MLSSSYFLKLLVTLQAILLAGSVKTENGGDGDSTSSTTKNGFSQLVDWMRNNGGRVDERLAVMEVGGVRGGVALADIEEGTELLHCPWALVIGSNSFEDQLGDDMCAVVRALEVELRLGEASLWHPYLTLDDSIVNSRLPTLWDADTLEELQGLAPQQDATRHIRWFSQFCDGNRPFAEVDEITKQALLCFITRASAVGMLPIYDLLNHHNGLRNAKIRLTAEYGVQLMAVQRIPKGSQIYLSYGIKSASTMYRDYGFVESWPQTWTWAWASPSSPSSTNSQSFVLFPDESVVINPTEQFLRDIWKGGISLSEFQEKATTHTQGLALEALEQFRREAYNLLSGLPTTVGDDKAILTNLKDSVSKLSADETVSEGALIVKYKDTISAVEYRISFKEAVYSAMKVSEATLLQLSPDQNEL